MHSNRQSTTHQRTNQKYKEHQTSSCWFLAKEEMRECGCGCCSLLKAEAVTPLNKSGRWIHNCQHQRYWQFCEDCQRDSLRRSSSHRRGSWCCFLSVMSNSCDGYRSHTCDHEFFHTVTCYHMITGLLFDFITYV